MAAVSYEPHPLLLPPILSRVFSFLDEKEIIQCFIVCSVWASEAKVALSNRITVTISNRRQLNAFLCRLTASPWKKVVVDLSLRNVSLDLSSTDFSLLMSRVSSSLQRLTIDTCLVETMEPVHYIIEHALNLTHLSLVTLKTSPVGGIGYSLRHALLPIYKSDPEFPLTPISFPFIKSFEYMNYDTSFDSDETLLTRVIETFPNLESLIAKNLKTDSPEMYVGLRLPKLTSLTVFMVASPSMRQVTELHVKVFQNLQLKLKKLELYSVDTGIRDGVLCEWIESQGETLHELTLEQIMNEEDVRIPCFPLQLPNLRSLTLDRSFTKNINDVLSQKYLPQLRELEFKFSQSSDWTKIFPKKLQNHERVELLTISFIDSTSLEKVLMCLPNLNTLTLDHADNSLLSVVFKTSTKLTTLKCFDDAEQQAAVMTAEGITGRRNSRLTTPRTQPYIGLLKEKHRKPQCDVFFNQDCDFPKRRVFPHPCNDLKMIQLHFSVPTNVSIIRKGIFDCTKLSTLILVGCKLPKKLLTQISRKRQLRDLHIPKSILLKQKIILDKESDYPVHCLGKYEDYFKRTLQIDDPDWSDCD